MSKGMKRPSLRDLSRRWPGDQDGYAFQAELIAGPDRASALVACAMVDTALMDAVCSAIDLWDKDAKERLFEREGAPLSGLRNKILLGRSLRIFDDATHRELNVIRNVRNAFAHSVYPLTFDNQLISNECTKLPNSSFEPEPHLHPMRVRYLAVCMTLCFKFLDYETPVP
jgi:hypothetical protein